MGTIVDWQIPFTYFLILVNEVFFEFEWAYEFWDISVPTKTNIVFIPEIILFLGIHFCINLFNN